MASGVIQAQRMAAMKSMLMQAWRERWSDMQWSINAKRLLPPSGTNENAQLAELLLQQALVGSSPNLHLLSYLRHALATQMVSHSAALRHIVLFTDINKPFCLRSLLDLVSGFTGKLSVRGNTEDSLSLAKAMLQLLRWLYELMYQALQKIKEDPQAMEYFQVIERACNITAILREDEAAKALLYVARLDESETFREIEHNSDNVRGFLGQMQKDVIPVELQENMGRSLWLVERVIKLIPEQQKLLEVSHQPLNVSLNALLTLEAILNPTNDIQSFTEQILVIEKMQGISRPELYCEMFRTCLLGVIDAAGGQDEIKWAAFAFLKLPQVLVRLHQASTGTSRASDLEAGIDLLLTYAPLLDLADTKCSNCDLLNYLLHELGENKYSLLSKEQIKNVTRRRQAKSQKPKMLEQGAAQQSIGLILRAEPTVQSILKTLDADYSRNQDALLGVLCHMLSGKSFELILAAAAATGRLQSFVVKLIKFNEFAKQANGDSGKTAQTRGLLFDITFLMLCHIMQLYGTEIISTCQDANGSFFVQWTLRCLPEDWKYKSLELLAPPDHAKVEVLLRQFSPGDELVSNLTKWHEVCHNAPYAVQEVLFAWEHGVLNNDKVKAIMDNVKGRMCCLPVVVSAWLCSYINIIDEDLRKKPRTMLQQLLKPIVPDATNQYYNERSHLMQIILQRMIQMVLPRSNRSSAYTLPANRSAYQILIETFRTCFKKGCVDLKAIHMFEHLINVGGAKWFCEHVVREVLSNTRIEDLNKGISLVYAIFHIDLENLTLSLLHHTVPGLLQSAGSKLALLTDPGGVALAKLCVMCLVVLTRMRTMQKETPNIKRGRKRTRAEIDVDEPDDEGESDRPNKLRRLPVHDESLSLHSEGFNLGDLLSAREDAEPSPTYDPKDPLNKTLVTLFRLFSSVVSHNKVCQQTGFVMSFIEECVRSGPQTARFVLQFMPLNLVSQLMKCLPAEMNPELLVSICDLSTTTGRRITTKVISQNAKWHQMQRANLTPQT